MKARFRISTRKRGFLLHKFQVRQNNKTKDIMNYGWLATCRTEGTWVNLVHSIVQRLSV